MAVTIEQYPNEKVIPAYKDTIIVLKDLYASALTSYRYILNITIPAEETTIKLKAIPNNEGVGIFNVSSVLQDYINTDKADVASSTTAIHKIGKYSRNKNNLIGVVFTAQAEFDLGSGIETQYIATTVGNTSGYRFWNGCSEHVNGLTFDYTPYILDGTSKKLLTGLAPTIKRKVRLGDYGTVAFFRGIFTDMDGTANSSDVDQFRVRFYDSSDTLLSSTTVTNSTANGGTAVNNSQPTTKGLLYFGAYPKNLTDGGLTIPATTAYYTVFAENSTGTDISDTYTFEVETDDCKGFETIRLAWLNRLGAWDYYNFTKKSTRSTNIKRSPFKSNYGTWQGETFSYGTFEGGVNSYSVTPTETIEANTNFISEAEAAALEELFTSPQVYMQNANGDFEQVAITETNYLKQTTANDMLKQYVIGLQKSHTKRVQRI